MDPQALIDTSYLAPLPAPFWFVQFFKVLGFVLHLVLMNLWYAGVPVAVGLWLSGHLHGRRLTTRLISQMPLIIAFGVNFGIVPLLFIQVAYGKFFYPATILMAWTWFSVFVLLTFAYYGIYLFAHGLKKHGENLPKRYAAAGWVSALVFLVLGFVFANAMSLMSNVAAWPGLLQDHSRHGAAIGTALNTGDPTLWPRWLMLFGLALTTFAVWVVVDAAWFARNESAAYRQWSLRFAWKTHTVGLVIFAVMGSWYVFGAWPAEVRDRMLHGPMIAHTLLTGAVPGVVWLLLTRLAHASDSTMLQPARGWAAAVLLAQVGVLAINAVSRQMVQNIELQRYSVSLWKETATQWSPMAMFLGAFVIGLAVIAWMILQVVRAEKAAN